MPATLPTPRPARATDLFASPAPRLGSRPVPVLTSCDALFASFSGVDYIRGGVTFDEGPIRYAILNTRVYGSSVIGSRDGDDVYKLTLVSIDAARLDLDFPAPGGFVTAATAAAIRAAIAAWHEGF